MSRFLLNFPIFLLLVSLFGCGKGDASSDLPTASTEVDTTAAAPVTSTETILYTWVDGLNVRDQPTTKGKTVARVKPNEPLTFTGETSLTSETIVLRGVAYHEPWMKISTADKKDGWVFGGAVKEKEELKGNASISDSKFEFPVFGFYDLSKWEEVSRDDEGTGGDAESENVTYRLEDRMLKITKTDVGEYGNMKSYTLLDKAGNVLKERNFDFSADGEFKLTEMVIDHTDIPAKRYTRSQVLDKHLMKLNARPEMVLGNWVITDAD